MSGGESGWVHGRYHKRSTSCRNAQGRGCEIAATPLNAYTVDNGLLPSLVGAGWATGASGLRYLFCITRDSAARNTLEVERLLLSVRNLD